MYPGKLPPLAPRRGGATWKKKIPPFLKKIYFYFFFKFFFYIIIILIIFMLFFHSPRMVMGPPRGGGGFKTILGSFWDYFFFFFFFFLVSPWLLRGVFLSNSSNVFFIVPPFPSPQILIPETIIPLVFSMLGLKTAGIKGGRGRSLIKFFFFSFKFGCSQKEKGFNREGNFRTCGGRVFQHPDLVALGSSSRKGKGGKRGGWWRRERG